MPYPPRLMGRLVAVLLIAAGTGTFTPKPPLPCEGRKQVWIENSFVYRQFGCTDPVPIDGNMKAPWPKPRPKSVSV